jgi:PKD repeat protein
MNKKLKLAALSCLVVLTLASSGVLTAEQSSSTSVSTGGGNCITASKSVQPDWIYPRGYGEPDLATVTLTIRGASAGWSRLPLDFVFIVDRSATIDITEVRSAVAQISGLLGAEDHIGLVSFADTARQDSGLTQATERHKEQFFQTVDELITEGKTACDAGVSEAIALLEDEGRPCAIRIVLMLTDGICTHGREPDGELREAVKKGIVPFVVGVGMVSHRFPTKIQEVEGAEFFTSAAFFIDYLERALQGIEDLAAVNLTLTEELPDYIVYENEASEYPLSIDPPGKGLILKWSHEALEMGQSWQISFAVRAKQTGELLVDQEGWIEYDNPLTGYPMPPVSLPNAIIRVRNAPPVCGFTYEPVNPSTADDVNFFDESYDPFGKTIVSWEWDFGDDSGSPKRNPTHRYSRKGTYSVSLTVCDSEGACCETGRQITVDLVEVNAARSAVTFPFDQVLPGRSYEVNVLIDPEDGVCIRGMGLKEVYPQGWEIKPVDNDSAQFKPPNEWVWQEPLGAGCMEEDPPDPKVKYKVAIPPGLAGGLYSVSGTVSSFAPRFDIGVGGFSTLEVVEELPLKVAIACLDVATGVPAPESCYDGGGRAVITQAQIERAKELYHSGEPVPATGGKTIDYENMLELLAYHDTGTPVTQPLPH